MDNALPALLRAATRPRRVALFARLVGAMILATVASTCASGRAGSSMQSHDPDAKDWIGLFNRLAG